LGISHEDELDALPTFLESILEEESLSEVWGRAITNDSWYAALIKKQRTGKFGRGVPVTDWKSIIVSK